MTDRSGAGASTAAGAGALPLRAMTQGQCEHGVGGDFGSRSAQTGQHAASPPCALADAQQQTPVNTPGQFPQIAGRMARKKIRARRLRATGTQGYTRLRKSE